MASCRFLGSERDDPPVAIPLKLADLDRSPQADIQEGWATINSDYRLSPDEKNAAQCMIPDAVTKGRFVA